MSTPAITPALVGPVNPFAPQIYTGAYPGPPPGFEDIGHDYVYDVVLTALQSLSQSKTVDLDSDFVWKAMITSTSTGTYSVRFNILGWYFLSSSQILSTNLLGDVSAPYTLGAPLLVPAGGRIGIDITDISNAGNTIQIVFRGSKRYRRNT